MSTITRRADAGIAGLSALRSTESDGSRSSHGASLVELMFAVAVVAICLGMALPALLVTREDWIARQATAYVVGQMMLARSQAARYGAAVGLRFENSGGNVSFSKYVDGDGDGIRNGDIADGVDSALEFIHGLSEHYPAVRFGFADDVPPVGGDPSLSGSDPVRFGAGDILTFSPLGTASSGTVYLAGPRQHQYAVRILGTTGRLRVLRFDRGSRVWTDR